MHLRSWLRAALRRLGYDVSLQVSRYRRAPQAEPRPPAGLEEKLLHNFHELNDRERLTYHVEIRPGLSAERRFLFEGDPRCFGQLWVADRQALFDVVRRCTPRVCVEVGTFTGGGSTFFIASALKDNGGGMLFSFEIDEPLHRLASCFYTRCLPQLAPHVSFHHGPVDARAL